MFRNACSVGTKRAYCVCAPTTPVFSPAARLGHHDLPNRLPSPAQLAQIQVGIKLHRYPTRPSLTPASEASRILGKKGSRWGGSYAAVHFPVSGLQQRILENPYNFGA